MEIKEVVHRIFELDDEIIALKDQFGRFSTAERADLLAEQFSQALSDTEEPDPLPMRLIRIAELLGNVEGDRAARILSQGLDHDNADVRMLCAEALFQLASDEFDLIEPAISEAFKRGGVAAEEMLSLLAEISTPEACRAVERFLKAEQPELVAVAIETLAEVGDELSVSALQKMTRDKRTIAMSEGEESEPVECTIGQLAQDAIDMIEEEE